MGQRKRMSFTDIIKLNKMYKCDSSQAPYKLESFCERNPNLPACLALHLSKK